MNKFIFATIVILMGTILACQETKEDLRTPLSTKEFYKTIGEQIPSERGMEWIENYRNTYSSSGRTEIVSEYSVSESQMNAVLSSAGDLIGVAFHYGMDNDGVTHIILIPVNETMSLWASIPGRIFVDANNGNPIDQNTAQAWATNYKNAHPSGVWFHFFGKYIFDDMAALPYFDSIDIQRGLNLLGLTPELLLIVWNDDLNILGRTAGQSCTVYDASNACPPCAAR